MRIENIEKDEKIRKVEDIQRELKVENTHLTEENHKLTKEINDKKLQSPDLKPEMNQQLVTSLEI